MKTTFRHVLQLLTVVICIGIAVYAVSLRRGLRQEEQSVIRVEGRAAELHATVRALHEDQRTLLAELAAQSNRAVRAEALAAEERATQEPLRAQVRTLLVSQAAASSRLAAADGLTKQLDEERRKAAAAADRATRAEARVAELEKATPPPPNAGG